MFIVFSLVRAVLIGNVEPEGTHGGPFPSSPSVDDREQITLPYLLAFRSKTLLDFSK